MIITNRLNLPLPILNSVTHWDGQYRREADTFVSVTELLRPPYQWALQKKHQNTIEKDVSDDVQNWIGHAIHHALASANQGKPGIHCEERLSYSIKGRLISGGYDYYDETNALLIDFKTTSAYNYPYLKSDGENSRFAEWSKQTNIYAYFLKRSGKPVNSIKINVVFYDWKASHATKHTYPKAPSVEMDVEMEPDIAIIKWLEERVELFEYALDGALTECTPAEKWEKESGERIRCDRYCNANKYCPSYLAYKK